MKTPPARIRSSMNRPAGGTGVESDPGARILHATHGRLDDDRVGLVGVVRHQRRRLVERAHQRVSEWRDGDRRELAGLYRFKIGHLSVGLAVLAVDRFASDPQLARLAGSPGDDGPFPNPARERTRPPQTLSSPASAFRTWSGPPTARSGRGLWLLVALRFPVRLGVFLHHRQPRVAVGELIQMSAGDLRG
jgi:hypothetical protein